MFNIIPNGDCITPKRIHKNSVGYYLIIPEDVKIEAHKRTAISLNFHINIPNGVIAEIKPLYRNSSIGIVGYGKRIVTEKKFIFSKQKTVSGYYTFNADVLPTVIDTSTESTIKIVVKNDDDEFFLNRGTKLAMITFHSAMSPFIAKVVEQNAELQEECIEDN